MVSNLENDNCSSRRSVCSMPKGIAKFLSDPSAADVSFSCSKYMYSGTMCKVRVNDRSRTVMFVSFSSPLSVRLFYRFSISLAPRIVLYASELVSENAKTEFFFVLLMPFFNGFEISVVLDWNSSKKLHPFVSTSFILTLKPDVARTAQNLGKLP